MSAPATLADAAKKLWRSGGVTFASLLSERTDDGTPTA
jgi:hypothetical protein